MLADMYQEHQQFAMPQRRVTKAVKKIIMATILVFCLQMLATDKVGILIKYYFGLSLGNVLSLYLWEPVTYMFLHSTENLFHVFFNMLVLYFFGCEMENVLGTKRFVRLYFACGIIAGVGWLLMGLFRGDPGVCIGASGAVYGVMGAFAAMFPGRVITLFLFFVLPVSMTARTMIIGLGVMSLVLMFSSDGNIAHSAHLAGGLAGYLYGLLIAGNPGILGGDLFDEDAGGGEIIPEIKARLRRRTMRLLEDESPDQEEVNRILEKISAGGMESISSSEREVLEKASEQGRFG